MKKVLFSLIAVLFLSIVTGETYASPKPFYIKIKIGILAKWSIALSDCKPGWGICISFEDGMGQNFLGYDSDNNKLNLRISKDAPEARNLSSGFLEVKEDSPVDPRVISQFPNFPKNGKTIFIKKGIYKVTDEGDYLLIPIEYYMQ